MVGAPSLSELACAWIAEHQTVDFALQVTAVAVLALMTFAALLGSVYCMWWLRRLINRENRTKFIVAPVPVLRRGRVAGQEFELAEIVQAEAEGAIVSHEAIAELDRRVNAIEAALRATRRIR